MAKPVSFRWDPEFVARIDRARGDVPRTVWVRRAVERALEASPPAPEPASLVIRASDVKSRARRDVKPFPRKARDG